MDVLLDSNILIRSIDSASAQHSLPDRALISLQTGGHALCMVPQVLYELWVVATRPVADNGLGMRTADVSKTIVVLKRRFTFLDDPANLFDEWERLVVVHQVEGKAAHDARLVAAMNLLGLTHLLTFNQRHFARYPGIGLFDPQTVATSIP